MKKVFIIIASVIMSLTLVMILVMSLVKTNIKLDYGQDPEYIFVYNQSIEAYSKSSSSSEGLKSTDKEYSEILNLINDMTNISVFNRLMNGISLNSKPEQDLDGDFVAYNSDLKTKYVAVELTYVGERDAIVYYQGNSKVISYSSIIFIMHLSDKITDVDIYYGTNLSGSNREETYRQCVPIIEKAQTKKITNYIQNLVKNA